MDKLIEKLQNAVLREDEHLTALKDAARAFVATDGRQGTVDALIAAAKKHTNAAHQTSRCRKHVADRSN